MKQYESDVLTVESIISALYESISFREGEPNWARFRVLFFDNANLIHVKKDEVDFINVQEFITRFHNQIKKGHISSFYEYEINRRIETFDRIVHVFSTYVAKIVPEDEEIVGRGINSVQLINHKNRWWVSSIVWEAEKEEALIPDEYLP